MHSGAACADMGAASVPTRISPRVYGRSWSQLAVIAQRQGNTADPNSADEGDCRFACSVPSNGGWPSAGSASRRKTTSWSGVPTCPH